MKLPNLFGRKQNAPAGMMQHLSKLPTPPLNLTQAVLNHRHDAKNYRVGGIQPFDKAVKQLAWWCHTAGYTQKDFQDYLTYVLRIRFVGPTR